MGNYIGIADPNHIMSGKIKVEKGDTFVSESEDKFGFAAFQYLPDWRKEWPKDFKLLESGTRVTCENAATIAVLEDE